MGTIYKLISNLVAIAFGVIFIPIVLLLLIFTPIMAISSAVKIISSGYSVTSDYINIMISVVVLTYISLRFRNLRRIYFAFPSLFETIKYLIIANLFIAIGTDVLNWSHITLDPGRQKLGIAVFVLALVLWRVFVSIYYSKKPITSFMPRPEERMQNYSTKA
jgi:hypothetical protein